jgi:hypothetical protein
MRRRAPQRPSRRPVFLGCEGKSEHSYGTLLGRLARETAGVDVYIEVKLLQPGAGSPLQLVRRAVQIYRQIEKRRERFAIKAILLDHGGPQIDQQAIVCAVNGGIDYLIWQDPDHEALLLRHLPGCQTLRPPVGSMHILQHHWPEYQKGLSALQLANRIGLAEVLAATGVEPVLQAFLRSLGFNC